MRLSRRIAVVVVVSTLLILLAPLGAIAVGPVFFLLSLIPGYVLVVLTAIAAAILMRAFRESKFVLTALLILFVIQEVVLIVWMQGWTAESYYAGYMLSLGSPIIDPDLEQRLMRAFWIVAAVILSITIESLINSFLSSQPTFTKYSPRLLVLLLLCEATLLVLVQFSSTNSWRVTWRPQVSSLSPSGTREARLIPMNAFIDMNGLVIAREPGARVWRTIGRVGDILTESRNVRFDWSDRDSKVFLLLDTRGREYPVLGFDFRTNQEIDQGQVIGPPSSD